MRTDFQQFYVPPEQVGAETFFLSGDEHHHASRVLRKQVGDVISAVDGMGSLYEGRIHEMRRDQTVVEIMQMNKNVGEPKLRLVLAQAALKGGHFDLVIEKGVEIGVFAFQPMITDRVIARPEKSDRWRKKAIGAMKQCGRSYCPDVYDPVDFSSLFENNESDLLLIAHEEINPEVNDALDRLDGAATVTVFIGPEGGFTDAEIRFALDQGAHPISLGPRRLRAETAAIVAATKVLSAAGEMGGAGILSLTRGDETSGVSFLQDKSG